MDKREIHLLHGFNVRDQGLRTVGQVRDEFEEVGYTVRSLTYGYFFRARVRLCTRGVAKMLACLAPPGSVLIAHSHGCLTAVQAVEEGAKYSYLVLVNPALNRGCRFPSTLKHVDVWYSPHDRAVMLARWIPWSRWGDMGRVGYKGPTDARVRSFDMESVMHLDKMRHSDIWRHDHAQKKLVEITTGRIRGMQVNDVQKKVLPTA